MRRKFLFLGLGIAVAVAGAVQSGTFRSERAEATGCAYQKSTYNFFEHNILAVPSGCSYMKVKVWGGGGSSWSTQHDATVLATGAGGGGAFVFGIANVAPGQTYDFYRELRGNVFGTGGGAAGFRSTNINPTLNWIRAGGGGGGGALTNTISYLHLGNGGGGGGVKGGNGEDSSVDGKIGGGGLGGTQTAGGMGGLNIPNDPSCYGGNGQLFLGGLPTCNGASKAGKGGYGYYGGGAGGSGGALSSGYPANGGGGGASSWIASGLFDSVGQYMRSGGIISAAREDEPDWINQSGRGGAPGVDNDYSATGKDGEVVVIFGQDVTVAESIFPFNWGSSNSNVLCSHKAPQTPQTGAYPGPISQYCTGTTISCRAPLDGTSGFVCRYQCTANLESTFVFHQVCN